MAANFYLDRLPKSRLRVTTYEGMVTIQPQDNPSVQQDFFYRLVITNNILTDRVDHEITWIEREPPRLAETNQTIIEMAQNHIH